MSKFKVGDEVCLKSKYKTKGEVTAHREGTGLKVVKWEPNGRYGSHFEHELALLDSVLPNLGSSHKFKVGDAVGLKQDSCAPSNYDPYNTKGVVEEAQHGLCSVKWEGLSIPSLYDSQDLYLWEDIATPKVTKLVDLPTTGEVSYMAIRNKDHVKPSNWTDKHYDHYLTVKLTPEDIAAGEVKVKIDPYVVNEVWGINSVEKTGAGFHCLKTLSRMANAKNSLEREWDALIGQSTRARELLNK